MLFIKPKRQANSLNVPVFISDKRLLFICEGSFNCKIVRRILLGSDELDAAVSQALD